MVSSRTKLIAVAVVVVISALALTSNLSSESTCDITKQKTECSDGEIAFIESIDALCVDRGVVEIADILETRKKRVLARIGHGGGETNWRADILDQLIAKNEGRSREEEKAQMAHILEETTPGRRTWKSTCPTPPAGLDSVGDWVTPSAVHSPASAACTRLEYVPSPWEAYWNKEIMNIADFGGLPGSYRRPDGAGAGIGWECGCTHMKASTNRAKAWLATWASRKGLANGKQVKWSRDVFSYHRIIDTCNGNRVTGQIPIEPLVGNLRHPRHHCQGDYHMDKDYMLSFSASEVIPPLDPLVRRAFLFDLGASTYDEGLGGASQSWFVESYASKGIVFDRIFAWEATVYEPSKIFDPVPSHVINRLTYFNVPADPRPGAKHNPLRLLMEVATPEDFVVIKIDIDYSPVESALIQQIQETLKLHNLIDELYYEHHVSGHPLHWTNWGRSVGKATIDQSFGNFTKLREAGIRAHSWV
eukprot:CAMPEP_0172585078 /NCGR_PEP_ID=MMETSP1068-20121228/4548_1 /TAXON_ID=35684 /ORGANISM="Pseudopedinella elastica, Strain CCMP716" /LENGTH=474 /DNA_ID=CAMNT_0013379421 /DNA_START=40 /DNA_END=1464 /DNA_ORIENTATION=+